MKILFLTGSRSDWGYAKPLIDECKKRKNIKFQLCITNMHMLNTFGSPMNEISKEGYQIDEKIYMALDGYNETTMSKSIGIFIQSFSDTLSRIKPDWLVLCGDRAETLGAAVTAAYSNILIAHVQAGEVSGNIDGQARHAITKFSHLHLASNDDSVKRLKKMGEEQFRIKKVGAPQIDDIIVLQSKKDKFDIIRKKYNLPPKKTYLTIVYHPVTEEFNKAEKNINLFIKILSKYKQPKVWIMPNNDAGSQIFKNYILKSRTSLDLIFDNMPREDYLYLIKNCLCMIGNSSSGIIESPSFKIPVIDIGRRQNNRVRAYNVVNVKNLNEKILHKAFVKVTSSDFAQKLKTLKNPYSMGLSSKLIIDHLIKANLHKRILLKEMTY